MNALILAAGYGSRLGDLTKYNQKCLLPIKGIPLIDYWIEYMVRIGINKIYINSHHCFNLLHEHLKKSPHIEKISVLYEENLLGTGGTLLQNIELFEEEDLFFLHGDNYVDFNYVKNFYKNFRSVKSTALFDMMLHVTNEPNLCGVVKLNNNLVTHFFEKINNPPSNIANSAIYILKKNFLASFKNLYKKIPLNFSEDVIPNHLGKIRGYLIEKEVIDIGIIERYELVK